MNKKNISIVIGFMCLILSYGISVQIKTINSIGTKTSTNATENELRDEVLKAKEKYDNLYNALEEAEKKLEQERTNATQNNTELTDLENSIKQGNKIAGLAEVTGPGMTIILEDNDKVTSNNILLDPNNALVHDIDVIRVVNELKNAGAEAISVNGQRIVTTTAIECDGNVITVNGVKIGTPFVIQAIGLPEQLNGLNRYGGYLMNLQENYGIKVTTKKEEEITIPKYSGVIKFEYAESK